MTVAAVEPPQRSRPTRARAGRLVLLRLGQLGVLHHGHRGLPRPVPDRRSPRTPSGRRTGDVHVLGHPDRVRFGLRVRGVALGDPAGVRAAGGRRDRRPVLAQEAAAGAVRLHRCRRDHRDGVPHRRPVPARRRAVPRSPTSRSARASSSTTRSCRSSPARTSATGSPASAGRIGYIGGGLLLLLNLVVLHARRRRSACPRATSPAGASSRPACGGPRSPRCRCCGCATGRRSPARRTGSVLHRRVPAARATLRKHAGVPADALLPRSRS